MTVLIISRYSSGESQHGFGYVGKYLLMIDNIEYFEKHLKTFIKEKQTMEEKETLNFSLFNPEENKIVVGWSINIQEDLTPCLLRSLVKMKLSPTDKHIYASVIADVGSLDRYDGFEIFTSDRLLPESVDESLFDTLDHIPDESSFNETYRLKPNRLVKRGVGPDLFDFESGLKIVRCIYREFAALKIQKVWDSYWYAPDATGRSRAAEKGYEKYKNAY